MYFFLNYSCNEIDEGKELVNIPSFVNISKFALILAMFRNDNAINYYLKKIQCY